MFLPSVFRRDCVELCNVVHHGGLQRDLLHEHRRGGDVLDLSLQENFICLDSEKRRVKLVFVVTTEFSDIYLQGELSNTSASSSGIKKVRFVQSPTVLKDTFIFIQLKSYSHAHVHISRVTVEYNVPPVHIVQEEKPTVEDFNAKREQTG